MLTLTLCSAGAAADVRRVVTALDAGDKAIALFDSCMTLDSGSSDTPSGRSLDNECGAGGTTDTAAADACVQRSA
jgi:hypothetical protein